MNGLAVSADRPGHLKLIRTYVSKKAARKGRAVLEGLGLDGPTITACFQDNPNNEEEAVQDGLAKWIGGEGTQPPTWDVLIRAMEGEIAQQYIGELKTELGCKLATAISL